MMVGCDSDMWSSNDSRGWLQNWLYCEFCTQPRLSFGLQMSELQVTIMIYVMMYREGGSSQMRQDGGSHSSHSNRPQKGA